MNMYQERENELYKSAELPNIQVTEAANIAAVKWADADTRVWHILLSRRSVTFGLAGSTYPSWARNNESTNALLERLRIFHAHIRKYSMFERPSLNAWMANYVLDNFYDRNFTHGTFMWVDMNGNMKSICLDYAPYNYHEVSSRFLNSIRCDTKCGTLTLDGVRVSTTNMALLPS